MFDSLSKILKLDLRYFLKGGFWITFNLISVTLTGLILSSLFARIWPKEIFGQFNFYISFLSVISLTALPGMPTVISQAASEGKSGVYKEVIKMILKWSFLGSVALLLAGIYFYFQGNLELAIIFIASAPAFPLASTSTLFGSYLTGLKQIKKASIMVTTSLVLSNLITILALYKYPNLIFVSLISTWSTAIINILFNLYILKQIKSQKTDKSLFKLGIHLSLSQVLTILADNIDKFLVPIMLGFTNNAIYAFAILIPNQIQGFLKSFLLLGQPKVTQMNEKDSYKILLNKTLQMEIFIAVITILYILLAPIIFHILYPAYANDALRLSQIFALGLLYYPVNLLFFDFVRNRKYEAFYKTNGVYLGISIITTFTLIPFLGIMGAILAKISTKFLFGAFQLYLFKRYSKKA